MPNKPRADNPHRYQQVHGECPTCGSRSLFLGDGGFVTCSWVECSEPDAASRVLNA